MWSLGNMCVTDDTCLCHVRKDLNSYNGKGYLIIDRLSFIYRGIRFTLVTHPVGYYYIESDRFPNGTFIKGYLYIIDDYVCVLGSYSNSLLDNTGEESLFFGNEFKILLLKNVSDRDDLKIPLIPPHITDIVWKDDKTCCVCRDDDVPRSNFVLTLCGHPYCKSCLKKLSECAFCRKPF